MALHLASLWNNNLTPRSGNLFVQRQGSLTAGCPNCWTKVTEALWTRLLKQRLWTTQKWHSERLGEKGNKCDLVKIKFFLKIVRFSHTGSLNPRELGGKISLCNKVVSYCAWPGGKPLSIDVFISCLFLRRMLLRPQ